MAKKQYFGVKYPFTSDGFQHFYVDANGSLEDKVKSQLMHVVFTPKMQRVRLPEFGTNLIKYIFEPNDTITWETVKNDVSDAVNRWCDNIALNNIEVVKNENDESEVFVRIDYRVTRGNKTTNDSIVVQI